MKKNKAILIFCLIFIILIVLVFGAGSYLNKNNFDKENILAAAVQQGGGGLPESRFTGALESTISYADVSSCDTSVGYISKDYVTNSAKTKRVLGCVYADTGSRIPTVVCSKSGYSAIKISGRDKNNNNKVVKIYVCKKNESSKAKYITTFSDTSYVDVSECDTSVGYISKDYVSDISGSKLVYGCAYSNTGSHVPNVRCSKDGYFAVLHNGRNASNNNAVNLYLCQKNSSNGSSTSPGGSESNNPSEQTPTNPEGGGITGGGNDSGTVLVGDRSPRLVYDDICASEGFRTGSKIAGIVILVAKWLAPLILIILGMVDFGKAFLSGDDKSLTDSTSKFLKRMLIAIIIPFIPGLLFYLVDFFVGEMKDENGESILDENGEFQYCTDCLKDPLNDCPIELYDYKNQN